MNRLLYLYLLAIILIIPSFVIGQEESYPRHFGDVFKSEDYLLGEGVFKGDVGLSLAKISFLNSQMNLTEFYRLASKVNISINLFNNFYVKNSFYFDLLDNEESPLWLSNHFYQIGVYNWRNKTVSYGYENYQPNRFRDAQFDYWTNFRRGLLFFSFNYEVSQGNYPTFPLLFDKTSKIIIVPVIRLQPEYVDMNNELLGYFKPILGANLRYVIWRNIYIETGLFYYPIANTKLPWDPDYTYGFGIFDWRAFKLNLSYGNWIANRFPWAEREMKHGFLNGEFTVNFTLEW